MLRQHKSQTSKRVRKQTGIALLELGIFLPVYLIILTCVIDLGRQFSRYSQLSAICYEGLRQLTQERGLEAGRYNEAQAAESKPIHNAIQNKLRNLVFLNKNRLPGDVAIITELKDNNVTIEMMTTYQPFFPVFGRNISVKTVMVGPYLYT